MTDELKPCPNPWCPTDSRRVTIWDLYSRRVICTCGVKGPSSATKADTNEHSIPIVNARQEQANVEAITAWNTRTPTPAAPQGAPETIWVDENRVVTNAPPSSPHYPSTPYTLKATSDARIAELEAKSIRLEGVISEYDERFVRFEARLVEIINLPDTTELTWCQKLARDAMGVTRGSALATARNEALEEADYLISLMMDAAQKLREAQDAHAFLSQYDKVSQMEATADELDAACEALKTSQEKGR